MDSLRVGVRCVGVNLGKTCEYDTIPPRHRSHLFLELSRGLTEYPSASR